MEKKPLVYLVGAGPGDIGLITVKGLKCLQRADVVVYDKLVNPELLQEVPRDAELVYVGKSKGNHLLPQKEINKLLAEKAKLGRVVVRLKGGDPYVFGRGGEEAQYLKSIGIPFEVIPGVTAGFAAAAYAGIPVTHRDFTSTVTLVTGHAKGEITCQPKVNWQSLASGNGTLVFYMGLSNLDTICRELIAHGRSADTPVAIISKATTPDQLTVTTTLESASQHIADLEISTPAIIIVGEVVTMQDELCWFGTN